MTERLADFDHPLVRETAARLIRGETIRAGKLRRLFLYVRDDIEFAFPDAGDLVKASETIRLGIGQCNTKATLLLALCRASDIPSRIRFSLIHKDIQKGFFTGIAYRLMPARLSHSWIEVEIDGRWRRIDTFINDLPLFEAARAELRRRHWTVGFSIALEDGNASAELDLDDEAFSQMVAVTDDHGVWDDPADYYASDRYRNRPGVLRMWAYRRLIGGVNRRVDALREGRIERGTAITSIEMATHLDAPPYRVWEELKKPRLLLFVSLPMIRFTPVKPEELPERWKEGDYVLRMTFYGVVPFGRQVVGISLPATEGGKRMLRDTGRGTLAKRWEHLISVEPDGEGTRYTDRVGIDAGFLHAARRGLRPPVLRASSGTVAKAGEGWVRLCRGRSIGISCGRA